ncbi:MAG: double-strand break repair protein AddB [Alphaproteobacteria bacterium]|nr:double-strand break repair protein AddB [Alphaproteobacteria bacterium]
MKKVFTISPVVSFSDELAKKLLKNYTPVDLMKMTLYLPTRRACKTMAEAFLRQNNGIPILLPKMIPFGSLDDKETELELNVKELSFLKPSISAMRRRLLLMKLVQQKDTDLSYQNALDLADALAEFMDECYIEELDFSKFDKIDVGDLSTHWQESLKFLQILKDVWPLILAEEGVCDKTDRQVQIFKGICDLWRKNPPTDIIIAAGSTGSQPATAEFLDVVSQLPNGMVILPGLDKILDEEAFEQIEPSHPQYHLKNLLKKMGINRQDVPEFVDIPPKYNEKMRLLTEIMRPAKTTDQWQKMKKFSAEDINHASFMICENQQQEAMAIALALREVLEHPEKTAALVTPDRNLAKRVVNIMKRWDVELDDSAGKSLVMTKLGAYLALVLEMGISGASPHALLALLKHPTTTAGLDFGQMNEIVRILEKECLHGPRPASFDAMKKIITDKIKKEAEKTNTGEEQFATRLEKTLPLIDSLKEKSSDFIEKMSSKEKFSFSDLLQIHLETAEALADSTDKAGEEKLWKGDDGEAAIKLIEEIKANADLLPDLTPVQYQAFILKLMDETSVRLKYGMSNRLDILGTMEARLIRPDLLILGELNEETWPKKIDADPWVSRPMRFDLGMSMPERKIALSAHDFCQGFCCDNVIITRSEKIGGTATVPSRWLLRLDAILKASGIEIDYKNNPFVTLAKKIDFPEQFIDFDVASPKPPVEKRPRKLSVTEIETWIRNPYAIYAKHILKLTKLDDIDKKIDVADFGNKVHAIFENFCKKFPDKWPENAKEEIELLVAEQIADLSVDKQAFWVPRIRKIADWFFNQMESRYKELNHTYPEVWGNIIFNRPGGDFELYGKVDRIDLINNSDENSKKEAHLIDYKTGYAPSNKEVLAGYAPQLPLEGILIQEGHFDEFEQTSISEVSKMEYWKVNGKDSGGTISQIKNDKREIVSTQELIDKAKSRLTETIDAFDNAEIPYLPTPNLAHVQRFNDYEHLERFKEWSVQDDETNSEIETEISENSNENA